MIKEYCEYAKTCVIRENAYGSQLDKFLRLFEEAKKDFPNLKENQITIVKYAGERYAKTFGIEFSASGNIPESYKLISQLEYT